jgi:hypothetical protein
MKDSNEGQRIYHEVIIQGITESPTDTPEEREFRARVTKQAAELRAQGGEPELWKAF